MGRPSREFRSSEFLLLMVGRRLISRAVFSSSILSDLEVKMNLSTRLWMTKGWEEHSMIFFMGGGERPEVWTDGQKLDMKQYIPSPAQISRIQTDPTVIN